MADVTATVLGLWRALSKRDLEAVPTFLSDDCIYLDMPVGPAAAARGPVDIVKRLKIGLEPLADYVNHDGLLITNGADAMYEHSETWTWDTGEVAVLRFVTVHKVREENGADKVSRVEGLLGHGFDGEPGAVDVA